MTKRGYAPGWMARCPKCPFEIDIASLGWTRIGAYSWGKRHPIHCPDCKRIRWMHIVHVDDHGHPDQSVGKVVAMVLLLQVIIATVVATILMATGLVPRPW